MNQSAPDNSKTTIAARSMLLVLAVGLFVVVWRSDGRTTPAKSSPESNEQVACSGMPQTETRISSSRPLAIEFVTQLADVAPPPNAAITPILPVLTCEPEQDSWRGPLPGGMTPGRYQVVRSDGRTFTVQVSHALLQSRGLMPSKTARDSYMLHDGRVRWYFIRIEEPVRPVVRMQSVRPPVMARKPARRVISAGMIQWLRAPMQRMSPMLVRGMQSTVENWKQQFSRSMDFARHWLPKTNRVSSGNAGTRR